MKVKTIQEFTPYERSCYEIGEAVLVRVGISLISMMVFLSAVALNAQAQGASRLGLNTTLRTVAEDIKSIQELGVGTIRVPLQWQFVKMRPGEYDWSSIDRFVKAAQAKKIEVLFTIHTTFREQKESPKTKRKKGSIQTSPINPPSVDAKEWVYFVETLANRCRGQGVNYEIESEVNSEAFWKGTLEEYLELLKSGYDVIKKVDPQAKVLPSAMGCGITRNFQSESESREAWKRHDKWFKAILSTKKFDVVNIHDYYFPSEIVANGLSFRSYLEHIQDVMKKSELGRFPVWITETGYVSSAADASGRMDNGSPEKQALWLKEAYEQAFQSGVERIYWLLLRDRKEPYVGSMGLADAKGNPRPAWNTLKQFAQEQMKKDERN